MVRKPRKTKAEKLQAVIGSGGLLNDIAAAAGVDRSTVRRWRDTDPAIAAAIEAERESTSDAAERTIINAIHSGDVNASKYWLSTIGRHRGFATRTEVDANVQAVGRVVVTIPHNGRDDIGHDPPN